MNAQAPALQRKISEIVEEYDEKLAKLETELEAYNRAGATLAEAASVAGSYGGRNLDLGRPSLSTLKDNLLTSAWRHVYDGLQIERLASPNDKRRFKMAMENPEPFTLDNIRGTFGNFVLDPKGNILRGLAEVFCELDPFYKSHDKVKIGVAGLPKRVVLSGFGDYSSYGKDRVKAILNALAAYQGKPLVEWQELDALMKNEDALLKTGAVEVRPRFGDGKPDFVSVIARGVRLRRFKNGNGHLFFEPDTLRDINKALAEYYGEVLPDTTDEKPAQKQASTAVSKDLQYYPTPQKVVERVLADLYPIKGQLVLEPSCGCGRFMDALRDAGAIPFGIEVDPVRAMQVKTKGHKVMQANFLQTVPDRRFDRVVMNPPFYGKHYAKHVEHARKFLKPGGVLTAILPATARYDHGLLDGRWEDLPVGSFSESGTNINTTVLTIREPE